MNAIFSYFKRDGSVQNAEKLQYLPILIWMEADKEVLEERVIKRISQMVKEGGMKEALDLF